MQSEFSTRLIHASMAQLTAILRLMNYKSLAIRLYSYDKRIGKQIKIIVFLPVIHVYMLASYRIMASMEIKVHLKYPKIPIMTRAAWQHNIGSQSTSSGKQPLFAKRINRFSPQVNKYPSKLQQIQLF